MTRSALIASILALLALSACGGGGGGGGGDDWDGEPIVGTGGGAGGGLTPGDDGGTEPFAWHLFATGGSEISSQELRVIRTQAEYDTLSAQVTVSEWGVAPPPIDFGEWMAVAVFLGSRPTARYHVTITNIVPQGADGIHVDYQEVIPIGPNCPPDLPVASRPFALAICTPRAGSATLSGIAVNADCTGTK